MRIERENQQTTDKISILIVDDIDDYLDYGKSILMQVANGHERYIYEKERIELAEQYFSIKTFNIVGEAMTYWAGGEARHTDVAIIDFDFSKLESGLPDIEYGTARGADLIKLIHPQKHTSLFCYTLFRKNLAEVAGIIDEKTQLLDKAKMDKDSKYQLLLRGAIRQQALNYFAKMIPTEKYQLYTVLNKQPLEPLLNRVISVENRRFLLKNLLIGWAEIYFNEPKEKIDIQYTLTSTDLLKLIRDDKQIKNFDS